MPIYRCANCGGEAEHPAPKCDPCRLDPAADARDGQHLTELAVIHFDPPHPTVRGRGRGVLACDEKRRLAPGVMVTGERSQVTCPACKAAAAFAAAAGVPAAPADSIVIGDLAAERAAAGGR